MVSVTLEECLSNELVERLQNEKMDVAFIRTSLSNHEGLAINSLVEERMVIALPRTHVLARSKSPIPFQCLATETFILYGPPGTGMYDATIAACLSAGFNPRVGNLGASTQQAPRITSTLSLVAAGAGISIVPSSLQRMKMEGVVYRTLKGNAPTALLKLASRRGDLSAVIRQFVNLVKKVAKDYT
jgi:DNA-binding transcriptional LysR family regulator